MELFIKYRNRKLYSKYKKRYVTLKNILKLVRQGVDIKVIEHESNEDVTKKTLLSAMKYKSFTEQDVYDILRS